MASSLARYFRRPGLSAKERMHILRKAEEVTGTKPDSLDTEVCFYVQASASFDDTQQRNLRWLLSETFEPMNFGLESFVHPEPSQHFVELGPRLNFSTAWSTNAVSICRACGVPVARIEQSRRLVFRFAKGLSAEHWSALVAALHDRMTECVYEKPLVSFSLNAKPEAWFYVPVKEQGEKALEELNAKMGLAFDSWDITYYTTLFKEKMGRNPTNVEIFDLSQSNSEHSRHWFFRGKLVIDGAEIAESLMDIVRAPLRRNQANSVVAFNDNAGAISGFEVRALLPTKPGQSCALDTKTVALDITFTAETHNFPTGIAPFAGAETGTGGRIRDSHACGRGSLVVAGIAAYCVGNLNIPGYDLPWEAKQWAYPPNMATPLQIIIDASNGASDYGNKFGEPVVCGFFRSFGMQIGDERREFIKPIMFAAGIGQMDAGHRRKGDPKRDMLVVKLGGPAYRIGIGGGAASSLAQGDNKASLDFNAVQRGDAEMEQKVNRVIRTCIELGVDNPIISIHDQGAGGNANVLKEIAEPIGARIEVRKILIGDETLSVLEIWGAEYQEADALLIDPANERTFADICCRERAPFASVGVVTGDGRIVLHDASDDSSPVDMPLDVVLGKMPQKTFTSQRRKLALPALKLPAFGTMQEALDAMLGRVLRLPDVASKRFLVTKVDRSVTGLVAQQPCVGPLHLPLADYAVIAQTYAGLTGAATAIGEQPIKGLIDAAAMARMAVGEALTNLMFVRITALEHVKCRGNWMWPAKFAGEGAAMYDAATAMANLMIELGIAIDGGKDSLSMAATVNKETVKAPGSLVISAYATVGDITCKVTPEIRHPGASRLLFIDISNGHHRLGGSALAHVYGQLGDKSPDVLAAPLRSAFLAVQSLLQKGLISAGHDRSDGGLIVTLLEMAFAGHCGLHIHLPHADDHVTIERLFAEELGVVVEVPTHHLAAVKEALDAAKLTWHDVAETTVERTVTLSVNNKQVYTSSTAKLHEAWEDTSFHLEPLQTEHGCVEQERAGLTHRHAPKYNLGGVELLQLPVLKQRPRVAVIREEGTNGDRELAAAFHLAEFEVHDVAMADLESAAVSLAAFSGVAFAGGFSYADVMDSAKGWSGKIRMNASLLAEFNAFYQRKDTFSLGICNGCQLMALLGWVPFGPLPDETHQPRFIRNACGRLESRWLTVRVEKSPAIMFKGMEGAVLGVWSVHGEGRAHFAHAPVMERVLSEHLSPLRFADDSGNLTMTYPMNPSGSPHGIAALCSPDGRHMAMMPHPERAFMKWQWPYLPLNQGKADGPSPWLRIFQNARVWCAEQLSK